MTDADQTLEDLRATAKDLGIAYYWSKGQETLEAEIAEAQGDPAVETEEDAPAEAEATEETGRIRKPSQRPTPPTPEDPGLPAPKTPVWVRNTTQRPVMLGIKYISPGAARVERFMDAVAAERVRPKAFDWRMTPRDKWQRLHETLAHAAAVEAANKEALEAYKAEVAK